MPASGPTGTIHLATRSPELSGDQMVAALTPPPQFAHASFESYRADPAFPSQQEAKELLIAFAGGPKRRAEVFSDAAPSSPS